MGETMNRSKDLIEYAVLALLIVPYFGVGALCHAIFHSAQFDWTSAATWGWLIAWPVALFLGFYGVILVGLFAIVIVTVLVTAISNVSHR